MREIISRQIIIIWLIIFYKGTDQADYYRNYRMRNIF